MRKFNRSHGLTESEQILAEICDGSFLSLWSYPNLFKSRNKELCDLLVVFEDVVIIFSDKSCAFKYHEDSGLAWKRWYRRSISESASQVRQAERWIRAYPKGVYLDSACTEPLPVELPTASEMKVYRVCVVSGGPTLEFDPSVKGDEREGFVGRVDEADGWIHVFDGRQIIPLLTELSTAGDFVDYLDKKQEAIATGSLIYAASELEIAAYFVRNNREIPSASCGLCLPLGMWDELRRHPAYQKRVRRDTLSQVWDEQIRRLTERYLEAELEAGNGLSVAEFERMTRFMAKERRFPRRVLSRWIAERVMRADAERAEIGSCLPSSASPELVYVLLVGTGSSREEHGEYRKERFQKLYLRCHAAKCVYPNARYFLGIAMDASGGRGGSEDYMLIDTMDWTQADIDLAQEMRSALGFFTHNQPTRFTEEEYE